jgi:hypothetical protein
MRSLQELMACEEIVVRHSELSGWYAFWVPKGLYLHQDSKWYRSTTTCLEVTGGGYYPTRDDTLAALELVFVAPDFVVKAVLS